MILQKICSTVCIEVTLIGGKAACLESRPAQGYLQTMSAGLPPSLWQQLSISKCQLAALMLPLGRQQPHEVRLFSSIGVQMHQHESSPYTIMTA